MSLFASQDNLFDAPLERTEGSDSRLPRWFARLICAVLGFVFRVCFRYEAEHVENLRAFKDKRGVVVICNHTSMLDVVFLFLSAWPTQWIRFIGKEGLFSAASGFVGWAAARMGAFPVKRDSADRTAIKRAAAMLKRGEIVGIMPEGTRRGRGTAEMKLHAGAALIARMGKAPILPSTVREVQNIKQKGQRIRFPKVTIDYGTPVLLSDFDFLPKEERLEACTWYAMREVFALRDRCAAEDVDMTELFPGQKDYSQVFIEHPIPVHDPLEVAGK